MFGPFVGEIKQDESECHQFWEIRSPDLSKVVAFVCAGEKPGNETKKTY